MAENAIMLLLPVVANCRRRYGRVARISNSFLVVYLYRLLEFVWWSWFGRRHQQLMYQRKCKNKRNTPYILVPHREPTPQRRYLVSTFFTARLCSLAVWIVSSGRLTVMTGPCAAHRLPLSASSAPRKHSHWTLKHRDFLHQLLLGLI